MSDVERVDGTYLGHVGCPKHGSKDSLALYEKTIDGEKVIDGHCWSVCGFISTKELREFEVLNDDNEVLVDYASSGRNYDKPVMTDFTHIEALDIRGWKERRLRKSTCDYFGVRTKTDDDDSVLARYYPVSRGGKVVGYKCRMIPKSFVGYGDTKVDTELFGQRVFPSHGKYLVITTGEEDAIAFAQVLKKDDYWTPCVSVTCGDGSVIKQLKANYDYINSFEKVILAFDNDKSGSEQVEAAAKLLKPGKAYIAKWPDGIKDACDMLKQGKDQGLRQVFWKAEPYSRVDVLHLSQMWDDFENEDNNVKIPFPPAFSHLNEMMNGGIEMGEVTVIGALTSGGKSTVINSLVYHWIENTPYKVGVMYLEGTKREVVRDLLSLDASVNLRRVDRSTIDMQSLKHKFFNNLAEKDKFVYVDHQGSISTKEIFEKFNYLAKAEGCRVIIIDPIQAGVNSSDNGAIIEFMDTLLKFAKETDVAVVAVSHMRKPSTDDPHDVNEYDLMGCVDSETEYLTDNGWKKISDYQEGDFVAVYDGETRKIRFDNTINYVIGDVDKFYHFKTRAGIDMMLSKNHRVPYLNYKSDIKIKTAYEIKENHDKNKKGFRGKIMHTFGNDGGEGIGLSEGEIRLSVAVKADGRIVKEGKDNYTQMRFRKKRKYDRLIELCEKFNLRYEDRGYRETSCGNIDYEVIVWPKCSDKSYNSWWNASLEELKIIADECLHWDGTVIHHKVFFSKNKEDADFIQYVFASVGIKAVVRKGTHVWETVLSKMPATGMSSGARGKCSINEFHDHNGKQYCFTTDTGLWVARRNGNIFVTGNSSSINQIAFNTILLSRDKLATDPIKRNATRLLLVKCRRTGETGEAGWIRYDHNSTHLYPTSNPYIEENTLDKDCDDFGDAVDNNDQEYEEFNLEEF